MPFINYNQSMKLLEQIDNGKCSGKCKQIWMRHLRNALKNKNNPLKLDKTKRKKLTKAINKIGKNKKTRKNSL